MGRRTDRNLDMRKLYFAKNDENSYTLDYHIEAAKSMGVLEIELYKAIPDRTLNNIIWCNIDNLPVLKEDCNKNDCLDFLGNKICKYRSKCLTKGAKIIIKL